MRRVLCCSYVCLTDDARFPRRDVLGGLRRREHRAASDLPMKDGREFIVRFALRKGARVWKIERTRRKRRVATLHGQPEVLARHRLDVAEKLAMPVRRRAAVGRVEHDVREEEIGLITP